MLKDDPMATPLRIKADRNTARIPNDERTQALVVRVSVRSKARLWEWARPTQQLLAATPQYRLPHLALFSTSIIHARTTVRYR
jgi:hypothetical protein